MTQKLVLSLTGLVMLVTMSCAVHPQSGYLARLEPPSGTYFGVLLDWEQDSPKAFNSRLGLPAAVYGEYIRFPFNIDNQRHLDTIVKLVAKERGIVFLTLEPEDGLKSITPDVAQELAVRLATYNQQGIPIFVRFAHEMNGSWYTWCQQPREFVRAFRLLAEAIHSTAPLTAMIWAPNYGGGYPFPFGHYRALPGTSDFQLLDTNRDGQLNMADDMYSPYYPGDDAVDWVGMSLYHWGRQYPWGENEVPEDATFMAKLTGTYAGLEGDHRPVPNFYGTYVQEHGKPMAITGTAAFYNPSAGGADERAIKQTWWRQVFSPQVARRFPGIKMILWFECRKYEREINGIVDWTITSNPELTRAFSNDLPRSHLIFADDLPTFITSPNTKRNAP